MALAVIGYGIAGYMVLFGASSGPVPPFDPQILNQKGGLFLTRPALAQYTATREELLWRAESLFSWIGQNNLNVRIGGAYNLTPNSQLFAAMAWEQAEAADRNG